MQTQPGVNKSGKQKGKKMGIPAKKTEAYLGQGMIDYLTGELMISKTMLSALLEITERTLSNWNDVAESELQESSKGKRLIALYDLVCRANKVGIRGKALLNLIQEPINPAEEDSGSLLYYINEEPGSRTLQEMVPLVIERFRREVS